MACDERRIVETVLPPWGVVLAKAFSWHQTSQIRWCERRTFVKIRDCMVELRKAFSKTERFRKQEEHGLQEVVAS